MAAQGHALIVSYQLKQPHAITRNVRILSIHKYFCVLLYLTRQIII